MCQQRSSRRDFFRNVMGSALAASPILELAAHRAAWAQAAAPFASTGLFNVQQVVDGVYFAVSRPQAIANCNAAIFVNSDHVLVVDAHSKPSAAASLFAQIKQDITPKPVRYLVDTHFHWDHAQGNAGYKAAAGGGKFDIVASNATKRLLTQLSKQRLRNTLTPNGPAVGGQPNVVETLETARRNLGTAATAEQKAQLTDRIRQLESYQAEMKNYEPTLPTITFDRTYVIRDKEHEIHVEFHGRAHTGGDVVVFSPEKRVVATGDMILSTMPFMMDGYPKEWPASIDSVSKLRFDYVLPGHGAVQQGRQRLTSFRNYIEELTTRVEQGKAAGKEVAALQAEIAPDSLRALTTNGYGASLGANMPNTVKTNIEHIYQRLGVR